jgi:hypothetical protein
VLAPCPYAVAQRLGKVIRAVADAKGRSWPIQIAKGRTRPEVAGRPSYGNIRFYIHSQRRIEVGRYWLARRCTPEEVAEIDRAVSLAADLERAERHPRYRPKLALTQSEWDRWTRDIGPVHGALEALSPHAPTYAILVYFDSAFRMP